jgi:hypothetical protein
MRSLTFDDVFAMHVAVALSAGDLTRLREWIANIAHPAECIALIEQAARGAAVSTLRSPEGAPLRPGQRAGRTRLVRTAERTESLLRGQAAERSRRYFFLVIADS